MFGSYGSTISEPAAEASARRDMLFWETGAVGEMTGRGAGELVFRVVPSGAILGRNAIAFIADEYAPVLGVDPSKLRYAVTLVDDAYGRAVAQGALDELAARGLHLVGRFGYDPRDVNMHAFVRDLAASRPDVVFVSAYLHDAIAMRREMVRQGLDVLVGIGTSSSYCMPTFGSTLGKDAVGLFASDKPASGALNIEGLTPTAGPCSNAHRPPTPDRFGGEMTRRGARRLLGRLGAAPRRAVDRRAADTVGDRERRERRRPAPGLAAERQRPTVRRARHRDRGRERPREQRGVAVASPRRVRGGLAAALRDEPDRAARPPAVTVRSRALGAGLAVVLVYAATAILSGHLSPLSRGPLLDGLAPPTAYRWVEPPPELAATNQKPTPGTFTVKLGNDGSKTAVFTTDDAQVTVILPEGSFADAEGQRSVQVTVEPAGGRDRQPGRPAARRGQRLPGRGDLSALGGAAAKLANPASVVIVYPLLANDHGGHSIIWSRSGERWKALDTDDLPSIQQAGADVDELGYLSVAGQPASPTGSGPPEADRPSPRSRSSPG